MSNVNAQTANWRLFGGGGLLLGGVLWLLGMIIQQSSASDLTTWMIRIGLIIVALGFFFVGWGETGSNGAVGNNMLGKLGLWAAGLGFLLWALAPIFGFMSSTLLTVIAILLVAGTLIAAVVIMQKGVAQGLAKWVMFLVFILALLFCIGLVAKVAVLLGAGVRITFAVVVAVTGVLYILNKKM